MHPTLVHLGPLPLHSYGFMLALSFFLGILLASRRAPGRGIAPDVVFDTSLVIVFASILGARALYVVFHLEEMSSPLDMIALWSGGLTMYGGVLAAMGAAFYYLRRRRVRFLAMADVMAPSLALGLGLTRIGCFLNGCCYGRPTTGPWGVHFPADSYVSGMFGGQALHPSQLYSAATGLAVLGILLLIDRKRGPEGRLFGIYLLLDAVGRFILDFYRSYEANVYIVRGFTVNQVICLGLAILGVAVLLQAAKQRRIGPAPDALSGSVLAAPSDPL